MHTLANIGPDVSQWVSAHADTLRTTVQHCDVDGEVTDRALDVVRQFIVDRQLILFGGLAIDYALRLCGDKIYPDDERPDFDFLSPQSVDDAYDLGEQLHALGFEDIAVIRGTHVQTMRVRTNFIYVADIGYVPRAVYDTIPTLIWQGMRFVHPDFQRADQHLAFCFPFNDAPREDIFNRWKKDLKRFNILNGYYPGLTSGLASDQPPQDTHSLTTSPMTVKLRAPITWKPDTVAPAAIALHGFAAYAMLCSVFDEVVAALGVAPPQLHAPWLAIKLGTNTVTVDIPSGGEMAFASYDAERYMAGGTWHYPYMDICPRTLRAGTGTPCTIYSTQSRLLAVSVCAAGADKVFVVSAQYLLLYFAYMAHRAGACGHSPPYHAFYAGTLEILIAAESLIAASTPSVESAVELFTNSPFAPSVVTMGDINQSASYAIMMAKNMATAGVSTEESRLLTDGLPVNYYPSRGTQRPTFDYAGNILFRRDGSVVGANASANASANADANASTPI